MLSTRCHPMFLYVCCVSFTYAVIISLVCSLGRVFTVCSVHWSRCETWCRGERSNPDTELWWSAAQSWIYVGTYLLNSLGAKYRQTTLSTDVWTLSLLHYMSGETTQGAARSGLWSSTTDRDDAAPQHQAFKRLYCFCFQWWCMMFVFDLLEYIPSFGDIQAELLS